MVSFSWLYNNSFVNFIKREWNKKKKDHINSLKHIAVFGLIVIFIRALKPENYQREKQFAADVDRIFPQMQMMIMSGVNQILQPILSQLEQEQPQQ
jgi:hypothetical protein